MPRALKAKKLILVLTTFTLMTDVKKETLECVPCIYYLIQFKKNLDEIWALINSKSEVNVMAPAYANKLDL